MTRNVLPLVACATLLASCFSTATVSDGTRDLPGIPFFAKTVVYRQTTEYSHLWTSAVLNIAAFKATTDGKKGPLLYSDSFARVAFDAPTRSLLTSVASRIEKKPDPTSAASIWLDFAKLPSVVPDTAVPQLTANVVEPTAVVDYSSRLYVNARAPWFGTASFEPKLAGDGTLQSVKVDTDSQLDEGIANLLPLKEYLTSILTPAVPGDDAGEAAMNLDAVPLFDRTKLRTLATKLKTTEPVIVELRLEQRPDGYKLVFAHDWKHSPIEAHACAGTVRLRPLALDLANGAYRRIEASAKKDAEKKEDDNSYSFSGSVKIPKADKKE